jgi:hypothetical protein
MTITEMIIHDYFIKTGKNLLRLDEVKIKRGEFKVATHPIAVKKQTL